MPDQTEMPDLLFIDTETTGLDPKIHRVIEIAATRVNFHPRTWGAPLASICYRFTPSTEDVARAEPDALAVNGYRQDHPDWATAPDIDSVDATQSWKNVATLARGAILVSQNVPFDRDFIWEELNARGLLYEHPKFGLLAPWARRFIDIQSYSALIAMEKSLSKMGLHDVYSAIGGAPLTEHRAASDVQRGMTVMRYVWDRFARGVSSLE